MAMLRPTEESEAFVDILSAPGLVNGFLAEPGDCAVIRSERPARLQLKIRAQGVEGSLDASFRIEPILYAGAPAAVAPQAAAQDAGGAGFKLVGHVARRGDVAVDPGVWIAGPESPAPIEGVGVLGALPAGLGVEIQPLVGTSPPRWLDWAPPGAFVGTRGRALPLVGLRMRLAGERAADFDLAVDALFLGSPIVSRRGRDIEVIGPAAGDPLVGLRLDLVSGGVESDIRAQDQASPESHSVERRKERKMRVFRAAAGA
jgi:hypothetical protein